MAETAHQLDNGEEMGYESDAMAEILMGGDEDEARMILGDRESISVAGVIRAGLKVPKNNCTDAQKKRFYELEKEGLPYDEIDKLLGGTPKSKSSKLFPKNVDHFVIRACDFRRPSDAEYLVNNFADSDGKVRRIRIWSPKDQISEIIPHSFKAFDGNNSVRAFTCYEDCKFVLKYLPMSVGKQPKPSDWKTVPFNPDDPKNIPKDCPPVKFGGQFRVHVPGIKGIGDIVLTTNSWYGLGDAVAALKDVRKVRGRISGLFRGEPFLELAKVPMIVKTPEGERQKQYVVTVDLCVDLMDIVHDREESVVRGSRAVNIFNGSPLSQSTAAPLIAASADPYGMGEPGDEPDTAAAASTKSSREVPKEVPIHPRENSTCKPEKTSAANQPVEPAQIQDPSAATKSDSQHGKEEPAAPTPAQNEQATNQPEAKPSPVAELETNASPAGGEQAESTNHSEAQESAAEQKNEISRPGAVRRDGKVPEDIAKGRTAIKELGRKGGLNEEELYAFAKQTLKGITFEDASRGDLEALYRSLNKRLREDYEKGTTTTRDECAELVKMAAAGGF